MSPTAIHPVPPLNGWGKSGINCYYYTWPWMHFFPAQNPCQLHPTASKHPQHQFWWCLCLHMFTYPHLTQIYPLHTPPYHSGIHGIKNTPTRLYKWIPAATAAPKGIPWCDISLLGNLPGRSLATYKYAPCWQTRDISYIILAYKAVISCSFVNVLAQIQYKYIRKTR